MTAADEPQATAAPRMKPWIEAIHAYVPGKSAGDDGRPLIKLSANENPFGSSPRAIAAGQAVSQPALYPDPDSTALREALGALHGIDPARIVCGTGSGELLTVAASAFAGPGDEVLYVRFGFSLYEIAARRCGATPVEAPDADYGTDVDALLACVTDRTRVVFVANPNNPTGSYLSRDELFRLHAGLRPDILLVIDHAYIEFVAPEDQDDALALAARHSNVLVTRTFSKVYGLAAVRAGWGTGHPDLIAALNRLRGPFNLSSHAQAMTLAALGDQAFVENTREKNRFGRLRFATALASLGNAGIRVVPSQANFILVLFEGALSAEAAYKGLAERGTIVRWLPGQGLPHALRITIGADEHMNAVAQAIREMAQTA